MFGRDRGRTNKVLYLFKFTTTKINRNRDESMRAAIIIAIIISQVTPLKVRNFSSTR